MNIKLIRLRIYYYFYLGLCRIINRFLILWAKFKGCKFDQMEKINLDYKLVCDLAYIGLITRYLINTIAYVDNERFDTPKPTEVTLWLKKGNCNDVSFCILSFLKKYKPFYEACLVIVYAPNWRGHAVCSIKLKEGWIHASNTGVVVKRFQTFEDLAADIKNDWSYFVVCDENLRLKEVVLRKS